MARIFCFGDSVTYGAWDISGSGWANRLRVYLDKKQDDNPDLYFLTYNLGVPGETTAGLRQRFLSEVENRTKKDNSDRKIFIFAHGTNDAAFVSSQNDFSVSLEEFVGNLKFVVGQAQSMGGDIFILNIIPVDESITADVNDKGKIRLNKWIDLYNERIKTVVADSKVSLIDVHSVFINQNYQDLLCEDGLHPNDLGHQTIFAKVLEDIGPTIGL